MCGICGIILDQEFKEADFKSLQSMREAMSHRGPDDHGSYLKGHVGLAMQRLSIIDLAGGHQPIHNEDQTVWVVFNGEIYNFQELRKELIGKGHHFYTGSDTEVIVHLYEEYSDECVQRLRGMFAFALWDTRRKTLLLARDRLGIKPLYYYHRNGCFLFASEIKALIQHPAVERQVSMRGLDCYFTYGYIPAPETIFQDIYKLSPASTLTLHQGNVSKQKYWNLHYTDKLEGDPDELSKELLERLRDSVRRHLISDVSLGAFLSGGVDSSVIVTLMREEMDRPIKTFTLGYRGKGSELDYARLVSKHLETDHHELIVSPEMTELLPELVWHQDEPLFDNSILPTFLVSKLAKEHVKVALSGDGGDELFGGYEWTRRYQFIRYYNQLPGGIRTIIRKLLLRDGQEAAYRSDFPSKLRRFISDTTLSLEEGFARRTTNSGPFRQQLYSEKTKMALDNYDALTLQSECFSQASVQDEREKMLYVDSMLFLPDDCLFKVDRMSMANSLEVRVPFLDHEFVEFTSRIPFSLKVSGLTTKRILKKAFASRLPSTILSQRKQGFTIPIADWLRGELGHLVEKIILHDKAKKRGLFNSDCLRWMLESHRSHRYNLSYQIWAVFIFEVWARLYLDRRDLTKPEASLRDLL